MAHWNRAQKSPSAYAPMLGLQLSLICTASCRSCAYSCEPRGGPVMSEIEARKIIDGAEGLNLKPIIAFTGGEPFLHYDLLKAVGGYAKDRLGYKLNVSTNGFWAKTPGKARRIMEEMAGLGLIALLFSVDDFHREYIDLKRVENGVRAAVDAGIACHLQCIETRSTRNIDWYRRHMDLPSDSDLVKWSGNPCDPVGRAARSVPPEELTLDWRKQPDCCSMLLALIVGVDGRVHNCCGTANREIPSLGNAYENPLPEIVNQANADPVLNALAAWGGPYLLAHVLAENGLPEYGENFYTSACHACHAIFSDPRATALVKEKLAPQQAELVGNRLMAQAMHREWAQGKGGDNLLMPGTGYELDGAAIDSEERRSA